MKEKEEQQLYCHREGSFPLVVLLLVGKRFISIPILVELDVPPHPFPSGSTWYLEMIKRHWFCWPI